MGERAKEEREEKETEKEGNKLPPQKGIARARELVTLSHTCNTHSEDEDTCRDETRCAQTPWYATAALVHSPFLAPSLSLNSCTHTQHTAHSYTFRP